MQHILIYGYGVEGRSTERYFTTHFPDYTLGIWDEGLGLGLDIELENWDLIFLSPGIDPGRLPQEFRSKVTNQCQYFLGQLPEDLRLKTIGITGSKGKTTTTQVIAQMCEEAGERVALGGNIGTPLLDCLPAVIAGEFDRIIIEVSSFQAEILETNPHITIFLNLFADHLDRHGDLAGVFEAKSGLWKHQEAHDILVVPDITHRQFQIQRAFSAPQLDLDFIPQNSILSAEHFRTNLGVLPVLAEVLGLEDSETCIKNALKNVQLAPHRLEYFATKGALDFYDDSISTNPDSAIAALDFFGDRLVYLILGGVTGGGDFTDLIQVFASKCPDGIILITQSEILSDFQKAAQMLDFQNFTVVKSLEEAVEIIDISKKGVCVLSPAAKSFDQYKNYKARGEAFKKLITV